MNDDDAVRPGTFGEALEQLMLRANVWDTTLARRLGVARPQVFRWRTGRAVPSRRSLERLVTALEWSSDGEQLPLTPFERDRLLSMAGRGGANLDGLLDPRDRADLPDRCTVYAHLYERRSFPSQWSRRIAEVERDVHGSMHCMLHRVPTFLQPPWMTRLYKKWYDADLVEQHVEHLADRRRRWEQRIEEYEVRHIYSMPRLAEYLRERRWQGYDLSREQVAEQMEILLGTLDAYYPNFAVGLADAPLPFGASIVGHETVLLLFREYHMVLADGWTISGMEMSGLSVVKTFSQAFDRTWGKRTLVKDPKEIRAWIMSQI